MYTLLLRLARKWHRWTAWGIGIFVLMWFMTGIVMVYPFGDPGREAPPNPIALDSTVIAPGVALRALEAQGSIGKVRSLQLRQIGDRTVYVISARGDSYAIDARTGAPFILAESTAVRVLTSLMREGATADYVVALRSRSADFEGPFPAFRVNFSGTVSATAYMSNIGDVRIKGGNARLKAIAGGLHTFVVPKLSMRVATRRNLIIAASLIACFLAFTGYVLLMPVRRRAES
ncbi:MAG: hypothetical protein ABIT38_09045 [Gemmatimonadaceae bacterium]